MYIFQQRMLGSHALSFNPIEAAKTIKYLTSGLVRRILPWETCLFDTTILLLQEPILPATLEATIVKWLSCRTVSPKRPVVRMIENNSDKTTNFTLQRGKWKKPFLNHRPHGSCMELWNQSYTRSHSQEILSQLQN